MSRKRHAHNGAHGGQGRAVPAVGARTPEEKRLLGTLLVVPFMFPWILAYSKDPIAFVALPGLIAWLTLVERLPRWHSVLQWGGLFGALATGYGYRWLAPTVQRFGGLAPWASWIVVGVFGIAGMLHAFVFAFIYRAMLRHGRPHPLSLICLMVAAETLPIRLFPWMIGHGAVEVAPLVQLAEYGGVPAVSFAFLCLIVPLHEWLRWAFIREEGASRPKAALVTFGLGLLLFGFGAVRYAQVRAEERDATRHLKVAIVQADVGSLEKRNAENGGLVRTDTIAAYRRGTLAADALDPDLIVWPETAMTDATPLEEPFQTSQIVRGNGWGFVNEIGERRAFLMGLYEQASGAAAVQNGRRIDARYNSAALREKGSLYASWQVYRKVYLIPFGEAMPFGLFEERLPQKFKMLPGEMPQKLLLLGDLRLAPFLCYEAILPEHVRAYVGDVHPDVLVSMANDSWFGDSWEPHQHLNFTRFRAVEHRAPIVRATNTGVSAFISATGDVESRLGVGLEGVLNADVPIVARGRTLYERQGHRLPQLMWVLAAALWILSLTRPLVVRRD